jgi:hypothetical protein
LLVNLFKSYDDARNYENHAVKYLAYTLTVTCCSHETEHTDVQCVASDLISFILNNLVLKFTEMLCAKRRSPDDIDQIIKHLEYVPSKINAL